MSDKVWAILFAIIFILLFMYTIYVFLSPEAYLLFEETAEGYGIPGFAMVILMIIVDVLLFLGIILGAKSSSKKPNVHVQ